MATLQCGSVTFPNIEAVIFDKDGTLADSQDFLRHLGQRRARLIDAQIPGVQEPLLMAFGLLNGNLNPLGLLAVGTRQENEIAAAAYIAETGRDWVDALKIARSSFAEADAVFSRKATQTPLFPGVLETLQRLQATSVKIGILSADSTPNVLDFIQCYHLEHLITLGLGIDQPPGKPDPTCFLRQCEALGVDPGATLVVGDSTADLEMARAGRAAGAIGVTWGWTNPTRLGEANVLIKSLTEITVV